MNRHLPMARLALLPLVMVLLAACGGSDDASDSGSAQVESTETDIAQSEPSVEASSAQTPTAAPESADEPESEPETEPDSAGQPEPETESESADERAPETESELADDVPADDDPSASTEGAVLSQFLQTMEVDESAELIACMTGEIAETGTSLAEAETGGGGEMFVALIRCEEPEELFDFFGAPTEADAAEAGVDLAEAECALLAFIAVFQEDSISDALALMESPEPPPKLIASMASSCDISEAAALALVQ